ncbi:MAG: carbon-nitrogen hydrolase family protein [Armatimonadetes bacterium]|nr:carbon-nitrogen hydrolase family protein [Armatimonadota bacterium]
MKRSCFAWRVALVAPLLGALVAVGMSWANVLGQGGCCWRGWECCRPSLKVAAVQARLRFFPTEAQYAAYIMTRVEQAMRYKPDLVVFPEDIGLPLVSLGECYVLCAESRTVEQAISKLVVRHAEELVGLSREVKAGPVRGLLLLKAGRIRRAYQTTFQAAAQRYHVYIVAGSVPMTFPDAPGQVFNTCCLFSPEGRMHVLGRKVHLIDLEGPQGLDLSAGKPESYRTFDVPLRRLGCCPTHRKTLARSKRPGVRIGCIVCADAWDPAIARRVVEDGAQVLIQVSANPGLWTVAEQDRWAAGLATRVEELGVYGVTCMAVGKLLDVPFEGCTQVVAPKAWTRDGTGLLADAPVVRSEAVVFARLDLRRVGWRP